MMKSKDSLDLFQHNLLNLLSAEILEHQAFRFYLKAIQHPSINRKIETPKVVQKRSFQHLLITSVLQIMQGLLVKLQLKLVAAQIRKM